LPPRFDLGRIVATPGALAAMNRNGQSGIEFLRRHQQGDWGEVGAGDANANDQAIASHERLLSAYRLNDQTKLWIITEADRSSTCLLLPDEY
jgi:hypothetical protein